mmetsp:Transcript_70741/g.147332  ORF Transcript_70741/g.147332 Transcript_70741/m.147332 type:complete len:220 (+) Transcript_70741:434-1093(+)
MKHASTAWHAGTATSAAPLPTTTPWHSASATRMPTPKHSRIGIRLRSRRNTAAVPVRNTPPYTSHITASCRLPSSAYSPPATTIASPPAAQQPYSPRRPTTRTPTKGSPDPPNTASPKQIDMPPTTRPTNHGKSRAARRSNSVASPRHSGSSTAAPGRRSPENVTRFCWNATSSHRPSSLCTLTVNRTGSLAGGPLVVREKPSSGTGVSKRATKCLPSV